jgi:hypothetical protein
MNVFIIFLLSINFILSFNIFNKNNLKYLYKQNLLKYSIITPLISNNKKLFLNPIYFTHNSIKNLSKIKINKKEKHLNYYNNKSYNITLLKTSILNFMPILKLHHIILFYDKKYNNIYTIDFSPINQTSIKTLLKLLFNQNVNAEIRIRLIKNVMLNDTNKIIEQWNNINKVDYITSQKISNETYNSIYNNEIKDFVKFIINYYNKSSIITCNKEKNQLMSKYYQNSLYNLMNLYNNNCQTFSKFILKKYKDFN